MPADSTNRTSTTNVVYRFAEFAVYPESGELFRNGERVRVQEQSLQVLLALLESPGTVVSREQLRERLWPNGTHVDFEHSLNTAVKRLRAVLGDNANNPRFIETLPKRGYRLTADISSESTPPPTLNEAPAGSTTQPKRTFRRAGGIVIVLLALAIIGMFGLLARRRANHKANVPAGISTSSQNGEAYELYLRSLGYKYEFPANAQAIVLLERSTSLDPRSARSWYELARRYDVEFTNDVRGQTFFQLAREASRRSLDLAPDFAPARLQQIILDVQGGQVASAYQAALAMTREHPEDAYAHFSLAYTLRYGGMFEEAAVECDRALAMDPTNARFLSCAMVNVLLRRYDRARTYIDLDPLSHLARYRRMELGILQNDEKAALEEARSIRVGPNSYVDARMMEAVLSEAPTETIRKLSREAEGLFDRTNTPEFYFVEARYQSWAGQPQAALRLLRRAIANNYCAYPVMDSDPFLANLRKLPEYPELRQAAITCRNTFRSHMAR